MNSDYSSANNNIISKDSKMVQKFENRVLLSAPHMTGEELKYIERAFASNWVTPLGPNVTEFENSVSKYLQQDGVYAIAMSTGTAAIHIALRLLNLKSDEEVFCSSATFIASVNPVLYEKATPVFIDSEDKTWNLCPQSLLKAIEHKKKTGKVPRILICADLFGMSANYPEIEEICKHHNIELIEDAAESLGSTLNGKKCGTFGKFGILSFNGNKIITTSGGGMLITHSKTEAERAVYLITQAREKADYYLHTEAGYNYRMSNISAGIGVGQMTALDDRVSSRRRIFNTYKELLKNTELNFLSGTNEYFSNHWLSTALIDSSSKKTPAELIKFLDSYNIEARHIWKPMHTQPIFKDHEFFSVYNKPVSEVIFDRGLCLPSCSYMDENTNIQVCEVIKKFFLKGTYRQQL